MDIPQLALWMTAGLGLAVARLLLEVSTRLPPSGRPVMRSWRREAALLIACPALGMWAQQVHPGAEGVLGALLAWQLLLLALLDAEHFWLPRSLTLSLIASGLLFALWGGLPAFADRAIGAAIGFLVLAAISKAYRLWRGHDGLGGGDAYLLAGGGAWVGWMSLPTVLVWAAAGGLVVVAVLALLGRRVGARQPLPFGVALAAGIWLAWLYGPLGRTGL